MDKILQELDNLIAFVKEASPILWQILCKQVYVEAAQDLLGAIVFSTISVILLRWAARIRSKKDIIDWEFCCVGCYIFSMLSGGIAFIAFVSAISRIINPEYYAIHIGLDLGK